ncbi:Betaine-aldehyde dehydrogenase [Novosphingobium aromaticivorans DSM 12444]|uniref:Betaine-aldehyde dehydrogenase n=1 Tax=Novosphingobium aromaticivorans (strain ATCC 700278 / DSM 12444 / CCUG 56034 / CIP 105152 / NBRC 16084 / F199) TaxID=279238 RepID=Q2G527_NOVAD|nr:aldehyde dehydrogenase [Novosphingobium aromaticivorans]ABD27046.1 Betaine-aldehyde dehydrogenase [Novosphingobium aromaticivorans DSM 12444]SCY48901.1 betaine-aldehyde dehydrogenase [Novosphingobium aromaticivorans]
MRERIDIAGIPVSPDHFIGGKRVSSPYTFETRCPFDWSWKLADISRGTVTTAAQAAQAATDAFPAWAALSAAERGAYLHRLADLIEANVEKLAMIECLDMGMLLESLRLRVILRGAANFRNYADLATGHEERVWSSRGTLNRVIRMPAGPALIITPWNAPFMLSTWKCAPALAAGNTVILKPADWSPLSASILADLIEEAGFPAGVFNIVQGLGAELGNALTSDPRIKRISFTGSVPTARVIGKAAAENIVPLTAELGGKSPLLVFADADIDAAAKKAAGQYDDSGQVCMAGTRIIVEESVKDEFLAKFHAYADAHVMGDSRDAATTMSALIHPVHVERVLGFIERARAAGDAIVRGGRLWKEGSNWIEPTLIEPKNNQSEVVQSEVFGPVLTFQTFRDEAEGVALANSTAYGLSGIVYTGSAERAERVGRQVRGGTVWVNTFLVRDLTAPFGGIGISGIGREGGDYALDFHSDLKTLQILEGSVV